MSNQYDIIIIGGGHNGLTAATTLARKNKKVLLLEKRAMLGGLAAGEEFHPGYASVGLLHDSSTVRSKVVEDLNLSQYGLDMAKERAPIVLLGKNGDTITLYSDTEKTCESIAKISSKDAEAYRTYRAFIDAISGFVNGLLNNMPPDLVNLGGSQLFELVKTGYGLKRLGNKTMMEFLKVAPMSAWDYLDELFETDFLKAGLAGPAIYGSWTSPRASYSNLNLLIWECTAQNHIVGGPAALVNALQKAAEAAGVEMKTEAEVKRILLDDDRKVRGVLLANGEEIVAKTVATSCSPKSTFLDLIAPNKLDYSLEHEMTHYRSRGMTAKVHLALNKEVSFNGQQETFFRTGNSFIEMEKSFDHSKYREFSKEPVLEIHVPEVKHIAPEGHQVVSVLLHYAPYTIEGGWTESAKKKLIDYVETALIGYSPEIGESVVATELLTPVDLEERYSLPNGHIFHGEHAVDQLLTRPIPACARYATPIEGLYLCGSGSFPGGGISCMPGYLGAKMILKS